MGLSSFIQKALSFEEEGGGPLCTHVVQQSSLPFVAASTTTRYTLSPPNESFAAIIYRTEADVTFPNAFDLNVIGKGIPVVTVRIPNVGMIIDAFQLFTARDRLNITVTNQDVVPHSLMLRNHYLCLETIDDLALLADKLETSYKDSIEVQLLKQLYEETKKTFNVLSTLRLGEKNE